MSAAEWIAQRRQIERESRPSGYGLVPTNAVNRYHADARRSLPLALEALEAVLEHHCSVPGPSSVGDYCRQCSGDEYEPYPCDVVRDIEATLNKEL